MTATGSRRARAYARWLEAHRRGVIACALVISIASGVLAAGLPLRGDFANLLPPSAESVQNLRTLQQRLRAFGSVFVALTAPDAQTRDRAASALEERLRAIDPSLVVHVSADDATARQYVWQNRFLFVEYDDLAHARDALEERVRRAKLDANPLYIALDEDLDEPAGDDRLEALMARFAEAEEKARAHAAFVSADGLMQLFIIRATFPASDIDRASALMPRIHRAIAEVENEHPGVEVGLSGNVATTLAEHHSILEGMIIAALITTIIVTIALLLYFRSLLAVGAVLWSLAVGTLATFGFTRLGIGHLNIATAFLAAIVVGNGINPNLILLSRYFEELRAGRKGTEALAAALRGASRGTLAASLTAGVAYASLIVTDFRGFRHFGIIGGVGMALCWIAAFTVLPSLLAAMEARGWVRPRREPRIGAWMARLVPERPRITLAVATVAIVVSGVATWRYIAGGPLEEDWKNLRSDNAELQRAHDWNHRIAIAFPQGFNRNISNRFAVALDDREDTPQVAALLRSLDDSEPDRAQLFSDVRSLDDLLPDRQEDKLALLAELRALLTPEVLAELDDDEREAIARLRPPPDLAAMQDEDVPEELAWPFIEQDGTRGRLVLATSSDRYDAWNVRDLVEWSGKVRELELPEDAIVGGQAFVFADMLASMERDGPLATAVAVIGSMLAVWLVVGMRRHGLTTIGCAVAGTLGMIALVSAFGVKVNFLDFIALPITVGIGIDYAVNIAARERQDRHMGPRYILATTGGAVMLCSFTTIVGYGSLLLSENAGIRSFGLAAILGEITCSIAALILAPALLAWLHARRGASAVEREHQSSDTDRFAA